MKIIKTTGTFGLSVWLLAAQVTQAADSGFHNGNR